LADRHKKALIFIVNAATPRARITGEAAVALSQHGTVAPITIHHRVDFAASMVDGRTVGEVLPDSPSAKEINELWIYIQDRLARLVKDPTLAPETRPEYFSISSLSGDVEEVDTVDHNTQPEDMQALNARLKDAYAPSANAADPAVANNSFGAPEPLASAPSEPALSQPKSEFGERKSAKPPSRGPTLFGGANRQVGTFGRRN
jgi:chromosome partitioning protein